MDQSELVEYGHRLVEALDASDYAPRFAMWVKKADHDIWRLWIVPKDKSLDEREFYRKMATTITDNRDKFQNFEASDIELVDDDHPALLGLKRAFRVECLSQIHISNITFNGFYLPEGIILRQTVG